MEKHQKVLKILQKNLKVFLKWRESGVLLLAVETVAYFGDGDQIARFIRVRLYLGAQGMDVGVKVVRFRGECFPPDLCQQFPVGHDMAVIPCDFPQQFKLSIGEGNVFTGQCDPVS